MFIGTILHQKGSCWDALNPTEQSSPSLWFLYLFWRLNQGWHCYSQIISNSFSTCPLLRELRCTEGCWPACQIHMEFLESSLLVTNPSSLLKSSSQSSLPTTSWKVEISQDTVLRHIRRLKAQCIFVTFHSVCRFTNSELPEDIYCVYWL